MTRLQAPQGYDLAGAAFDYPAWDGPPRRTVVICTHPRSGSTLLGEAIQRAGGLGCPLEYFHAGFRPSFERRWGALPRQAYVEKVWRERTDPGGTLAVKLMWNDIQDFVRELVPDRLSVFHELPAERIARADYRALGEVLAALFPRPVWVHLYRQDPVRQAVSAAIAAETGRWRHIPGVEDGPRPEPAFDAAEIERQINHAAFCHRHWRGFFSAIGAEPFTLTYEELSRDYAGTAGRLLAALGSDAAPAPARMLRQADALTERFVARYLHERARPGSA